MEQLIAYLIIINAVGLLVMLTDKKKAQKKHWRISESAIFSVAAIGGSVGILVGMQLFRHKTKHDSFTVGIPIILAVQIILVVCYILA